MDELQELEELEGTDFEMLPPEVKVKIFENLTYDDAVELCMSNKSFASFCREYEEMNYSRRLREKYPGFNREVTLGRARELWNNLEAYEWSENNPRHDVAFECRRILVKLEWNYGRLPYDLENNLTFEHIPIVKIAPFFMILTEADLCVQYYSQDSDEIPTFYEILDGPVAMFDVFEVLIGQNMDYEIPNSIIKAYNAMGLDVDEEVLDSLPLSGSADITQDHYTRFSLEEGLIIGDEFVDYDGDIETMELQ